MLPTLNTGMPVVPFVDLSSSDGTLRNVDDGGIDVNLPLPPLRFGSATFTSAFVSDLICDSFFSISYMQPMQIIMNMYHACMYYGLAVATPY